MPEKYRLALGLGLIILVGFVISISTYKDYGVTADEEVEYNSGKVLLTYYLTGEVLNDKGIAERHLPDKSPYFRLYTAVLSALNPTGYYEVYHLLNMLAGIGLFIVIYLLLYFEYKKVWVALLGVGTLFLTPSLTGHIPANPKDIPFALLYFVSLMAVYFLNKYQVSLPVKILVLGPLFGLTFATRLVGGTIFFVYLVYSSLVTSDITPKKFGSVVLELCGILCLSFLVLLPLWPVLRVDFPQNIVNLIQVSVDFDSWDKTIFYGGKYLTKEFRPPSYLFVWLLLTTPLFTLISFAASPILFFRKSVKGRKLLLLAYLALGANFLAYLVIQPVIYNGLRHFLFLLPIIVLVGCVTVSELVYMRKPVFWGVIAGYLLLATPVFVNMLTLHPYEYIYFNGLAGGIPGAKDKYELDYWGATYKEAAEWLRVNVEDVPKVYACNLSYVTQYYSHGKFEMVNNSDQAEYIICDLDNDRQRAWDYPVIYTIARQNTPLNIIRTAELNR